MGCYARLTGGVHHCIQAKCTARHCPGAAFDCSPHAKLVFTCLVDTCKVRGSSVCWCFSRSSSVCRCTTTWHSYQAGKPCLLVRLLAAWLADVPKIQAVASLVSAGFCVLSLRPKSITRVYRCTHSCSHHVLMPNIESATVTLF